MDSIRNPLRVNTDSLKGVNRLLASTLEDLRYQVGLMEFGQRMCDPAEGIIGVVAAARSIPIVRHDLEKAFFKTPDPERISEDTYSMIKQEINDIENYVNSYPQLIDDKCSCKLRQNR